ncbi:MAG: helix-turn-helix domain-containing protein [Candidatus Pristimantibacillus sp.]
MIIKHEENALSDLLQSLQLQLLTAHQTKVTVNWGETNSVQPYNKLYLITDGEGWLKIGNEQFNPRPGQLCLVPAHMQHSFAAISDRPYSKYWCHFNVTVGPFDLFQWIGVPLCIDLADTNKMIQLFQDMTAWHHQDSIIARLREKMLLLEIITCFLELVPIRVLQHRTEEMNRLSVIQHYVENSLHTSIKLEQMAEAVHLHPNYFISYFKKHFGVSPLKYVNRKRTDRAKLLLSTTSLSVKEIADQTGFKETNHFTKFFRKETSLSPTDYRVAYSQS